MPCSFVQLAHVVVCVRVLVGVLGVMIVVFIGHDEVRAVGAVLVSIFIVFFFTWKCILKTPCRTVNCDDCHRHDHCNLAPNSL